MRRWIVGAALFAGLAAPAFAKDVVLPAKEPAVTATLPDDWDTSVYETEVASVSADGDIVFNIATDSRSRLDTLIKDSKAYLTKNKVKLVGKPTEQTIDFNGTPGQVLRYQATDKNGKAIIDFVTLDASRNRVVLLTVWGSQDDRETNDAALASIMKSVTIPAGGGGGSAFWSGGPAPAGKVVAGKSEAGKSEAAAPEAVKPSPTPAVSARAASQSLGVRRVLFVSRPSASFGDADARASNAFLPSEKVITYMEPVGETLVPVAGDNLRFGMVIDSEVRTATGTILGGQKGAIDKEFTVGKDTLKDGNPQFYFDFTLGIAGLDPGDYVVGFTLRDKFSERTTQIDRPFTVLAGPAATAAAPAPTAPATPTPAAPAPVVAASPPSPQGSGLCAQADVRKDLMTSVNAGPDFKDGKRRLKELAEPETVFEDRKAKLMTCRYTSVWDETRDTGVAEKRMKMTFKISDDGKDGIDIDYSFDK